MQLNDRIYGKIVIHDQIIQDIISTKPFQRLKEINQYGGVNFVYQNSYQTSRFEHSIGVWYATYMLGADLETQIAALLHDVGHFAFSHLVDMAKSDSSENEHEFSPKDLEGWEEIEKILQKNDVHLKDTDLYKLIKNNLPDIGTDRLDYAIRDLESVIPYNDQFGAKVINDIELFEGEIVFKSSEVAKEFAERGNRAMYQVIYDPKIAVVYQSVVEILRDGIKDNWITKKDLLLTDSHVFELFKARKNEYDEKYFKVFTDRYNVVKVKEGEVCDFRFVKLKARYFDPRVKLSSGNIKRVSEIDKNAKAALEEYIQIFEESKKGINLRLVF